MKIYCNQDNLSLLDFVDKDIWVKCHANWGTFAENNVYMRILEIWDNPYYGEFWVRFNGCLATTVENYDLGLFSINETLEDMDYLYTGPMKEFSICQPLSVCTTEDLLEIIKSCDEPPFARGR